MNRNGAMALEVLVEAAGREEIVSRDQFLGQQRHLRQRGGDEFLPVLPVPAFPPHPTHLTDLTHATLVRVSEQLAHVCRLLA